MSAPKISTFSLLRHRLWPYVTKHPRLLAAGTFAVAISTACALTTPWFLGYTVDHVLMPKELSLLVPFGMLFLALDLCRAFMMFSQNYLFSLLGQRVLHDLRQDLLRQYQFYPLGEFNRTPTGRLVTRLVNDTSNLQDLFTGGLAVALGEGIVVVGILVWLVALHPRLGIVCVSVFPLIVLSSRVLGGRIGEAFRQSRIALAKLNGYLAENISGMWLIQIFNRQARFRERFERVSREYTGCQVRAVESFALFHPSVTILSSLSMSLLIWYGGSSAIQGVVSLGLLVTFMSYLQALYAPIRDITEKYNLFVAGMTSCERIFEFMDRPEEQGTNSLEQTAPAWPLAGIQATASLEFKGVWFRYNNNWALKSVSFKIAAGERIGIVGHTGAGKTTISALLMRFYDTQDGEILIDGRSITTLDKCTLRQAIGYIQQHPFLFSGTVEDNILLWDRQGRASLDALPESARRYLESGRFPLWKQIYEKGANLSAGERQIIAFLRALAQNPKVLILDEATANIDSQTEHWLSQISREAFEKRTVLIIAHRLATLKSVDRILVLDHGRLIESGTHAELLASGGAYRGLYEIQCRREELLGGITGSTQEPYSLSPQAQP